MSSQGALEGKSVDWTRFCTCRLTSLPPDVLVKCDFAAESAAMTFLSKINHPSTGCVLVVVVLLPVQQQASQTGVHWEGFWNLLRSSRICHLPPLLETISRGGIMYHPTEPVKERPVYMQMQRHAREMRMYCRIHGKRMNFWPRSRNKSQEIKCSVAAFPFPPLGCPFLI